MKSQRQLAFSALLLCTLHQAAAGSASASTSASDERGRLRHRSHGDRSREPKSQEASGSFSVNASRGNVTTVIPDGSGEPALCAYRMMERGIGGQLCFRHPLSGYRCHKGDCRSVVSFGSLVANVLTNGSVLLQWSTGRRNDTGTNSTREETLRSASTVSGGRRHRRGGFELSCWWNGSYTQFECAGVHLGSGCTDFLLNELHENIPYRICLRSLTPHDPPAGTPDPRDCVEFTLPPSGMQDIVIAMTTVGGAICVMLVIICLLVAYITENIMSPATQHSYSYRTHSRH